MQFRCSAWMLKMGHAGDVKEDFDRPQGPAFHPSVTAFSVKKGLMGGYTIEAFGTGLGSIAI